MDQGKQAKSSINTWAWWCLHNRPMFCFLTFRRKCFWSIILSHSFAQPKVNGLWPFSSLSVVIFTWDLERRAPQQCDQSSCFLWLSMSPSCNQTSQRMCLLLAICMGILNKLPGQDLITSTCFSFERTRGSKRTKHLKDQRKNNNNSVSYWNEIYL